MEKFKSSLLVILVFASLVQSYMLANSFPGFDVINRSDTMNRGSNNTGSELVGTKQEVDNLLFPRNVVLHFGNERHTVLYPDTRFYTMILQTIKQRTFDGFSQTSGSVIDWETYRDGHEGVEIRFGEGIPLSILKRMLLIKGDIPDGLDTINRIWIITRENQDEVRAFFFSAANSNVYEATKVDLTGPDIGMFVGFGQYLSTYHTYDGTYYLPDEPIPVIKFTYDFSEITSEQMQRSLFVDPETTRKLLERDGSEIYTDGKKGLQVSKVSRWMNYSDPGAQAENRSDPGEDLLSAVQYINQHGGWNGTFRVSSMPQQSTIGQAPFFFRQYAGSHPILDTQDVKFGYMKITLQKGLVSNYERSLIRINTDDASKSLVNLPGGEELHAILDQFTKKAMIRSVFPAYYPSVTDDTIVLTPMWAVELADGRFEFLQE